MVDIDTPPKRLPTARAWSLSAWPVRAKVAAVVALPLVLAMGFGALRVEAELSAAADLSSAVDNAQTVGPALELDRLVGDVALAGSAGADDEYQRAVASARDAVTTNLAESSPDVVAGFESALTAVDILRDRMRTGPVSTADRATVAEDTTDALAGVVAAASAADSAASRTLAGAVVDAMSGRRAAQSQQLFATVPDPTVIDRVNRIAGSESADIAALESVLGSDSTEVANLESLLETRLAIYATSAGSGPATPFLSAGESTNLYTTIADRTSSELVDSLSTEALDRRSIALRDTAIVLGAVLAALVLALIVARSLVRPIRRLTLGALGVAQRALPAEIEQIRSGGHTPEIVPIPVHTEEEIGQLARAVDAMHEEALQLAGEQTRLRVQVGSMFETLSRRSRSLVDQQLALIEELERDEDDPRRLDSLFRLDHLATRMRRNGANLMVLAGTSSRRVQGDQPVALDAVMSAAVSEVEDYRRVLMLDVPDAALTSAAAADVVHLVAELIDNALRYSPPDSAVAVTAARAVEGGILLEVADRGLGMPPADIAETNERLAAGGEVTPETARRMGLFVVGRLAQRHGVTVRLRATQVQGASSGVTVSVHIPVGLVVTSFPGTERHARPAGHSRQSPREPGSPAKPTVAVPETAAERTAPVSIVSPNGRGPTATANDMAEDTTTGALPRRRPGASGVDEHIALTSGRSDAPSDAPEPRLGAPSNTSAFFGARPAARSARENEPTARSTGNTGTTPAPPDPLAPPQAMPIYQRMVSEWLVDPATGQGRTRTWSSPADQGWAAAESAADAPVRTRTESGLPVRKPGARLVPGTVESTRVASSSHSASTRNPDAVRDKLTSHFTGVRTGRAEDVTGRHRTEDSE